MIRKTARVIGILVIVASLAQAGPAAGEDVLNPGLTVLYSVASDVYAWSPDGRRLAYALSDGIWVREAPGFDRPRQWVRKGRGDAHPIQQMAWSPDGTQLAFTASRPGDGWGTLWLAAGDGSTVRDLLPPGAPFVATGVRAVGIGAWISPRRIAFHTGCGTGSFVTGSVDVETGAYASLGAASVDAGFSWAPDGRRVLAGTHGFGLGLWEARDFGALAASSDSISEKPFRTTVQGCEGNQGTEYHLDGWSGDATRVLLTAWPCGTTPGVDSAPRLLLWDLRAGEPIQLLPDAGWGSFSLDGNRIASYVLQSGRVASVVVLQADDGTVLSDFPVDLEPPARPPAEAGVDPFHPRPLWSPDGRNLLVHNARGELLIVAADGSRRQHVTRGVRGEAAWSPDGKWLAVWIRERGFASLEESRGLDAFLPPTAAADTRSDTEIIDDYFRRMLEAGRGSDQQGWILIEHVRALAAMGRRDEAEAQLQEARRLVRENGSLRGTGLERMVRNPPPPPAAAGPDASSSTAQPALFIIEPP